MRHFARLACSTPLACALALGCGTGGGPPTQPADLAAASDGGVEPADLAASGSPDLARENMGPTCGAPPVCTPAAGTTKFVRLHGAIVTPSKVICDGDVLFSRETGLIACVGDCAAAPEAKDATVLCTDGVVFPGLISDHDHMQYNHLPPWRHAAKFGDRSQWQRDSGYRDFVQAYGDIQSQVCSTMKWAEARAVIGGSTAAVGTVGNAQCLAGLLRDLDQPDFMGVEVNGLGARVDSSTFPLNMDAAERMKVLDNVKSGSVSSFIAHVSEGINEDVRVEFEEYANVGLLFDRSAIVHATGLSARQFGAVVAGGVDVVVSPRSNIDLYGDLTPMPTARALGIGLALAPDWTPSGGMNQLDELRCTAHVNDVYWDRAFSDRELVEMVTINAARAASVDKKLGSLEAGKIADLTVVGAGRMRPYRALIDARVEDVALVLRSGRPLYGDPSLVTPIKPNDFCEPVPARTAMDQPGNVCGKMRVICLKDGAAQKDTLQAVKMNLETALAAKKAGKAACKMDPMACYQYDLFPLWDCAPPAEAKCDLGHDAITGKPTMADADGDSVADAMDSCPKVWNPPWVGTKAQEDSDGDGAGDACDACPLDPNRACAATNPMDLDGDGAPNGMDGCPFIYEKMQSDRDMDGKGDACDPCPDVANPGSSSCKLALRALRDPKHPAHPPVGTVVTVSDVHVTGIKSAGSGRGFFVQDAKEKDFGGLWVFTGSTSPTVKIGNRVTVLGRYTEYGGGLTEIEQFKTTVDDAGTMLPFGPIDVANPADLAKGGAKAEALESMLVRLMNVKTTSMCDQFDEIMLDGGALLDDHLYDGGVANKTPDFPVGTVFPTLTGPLYYSFGAHKIVPRDKADYGGKL